MTRSEWETCSNPVSMLEFLGGTASDRKLRLLAVACCARLRQFLADERCQDAIRLAEVAADGPVDQSVLRVAHRRARTAYWEFDRVAFPTGSDPDVLQLTRARHCVSVLLLDTMREATRVVCGLAAMVVGRATRTIGSTPESEAERAELRAQADLIRDIFDNSVRRVQLHRGWDTTTTRSLAQSIYAGRAFDHLAILADALQDTGCDDETILNHLRGGGLHTRGCWVVDLLLGRS